MKSHVIWFTGISGAGKSTLSEKLKKHLDQRSIKNELLDGDTVRNFFENDLGYSRSERIMNVKRIAFAAKLLSEQGVLTLVANIAPYYEARDFIRKKIPNYIQIYMKASVETVMKRDVKGHYKDFEKGQQKNLVGVDDKYDVPRKPDLVIDADTENLEESFTKLINLLKHRGIIKE